MHRLKEILHEQVMNLISSIMTMVETDHIAYGNIIKIQFFFQQYDPDKLMNSIMKYILPYTNIIHNRNDNFFKQSKIIFDGLPKDKINYFTELWSSGILDKEDQEIIFQFFDVFISCAEEYKKMP